MIENYSSVNNTLKPEPKESSRNVGVEFRCPQCYKLYKTHAKDIYSSQPQFECVSCHAQFTFDYPPRNSKAVYTRTLSLPQVSKLAKAQRNLPATAIVADSPELKECPKCHARNPRGVEDCYRCGIVFAKFESMQNESKVGMNLPSLMKMWQELMGDYSNMAKHLAFVDRCEELQALPFALKKYKDLREVQPQDSLAHQMLNSVLIKSLSRQASNMAAHPKMQWLRFMKNNIPWTNLFRISPLAFCGALIFLGLINHNNRNFAGGGVALLALILGFIFIQKGRLHWRQFWH